MALRRLFLPLCVLTLGMVSACDTVDLEDQPAGLNRCRPDRTFFIQRVWPEFLDKSLAGGKRCTDGGCHDATSGRQLILARPVSMPTVPLPPDWEAIYKSVTNQMLCTDVLQSDLLTRPDGRQTHGGGKLIDPNGVEAQLILQWVAVP